jgi:serine/threonine-protein phosphatase 4 regulatory subunit 1
MKLAFVKEVERVAGDPIYWVRREASYTLGALAKVIPAEIVVSSLVSVHLAEYAHQEYLTFPYSCPYSRICVETKSGMYDTPRSLHYPATLARLSPLATSSCRAPCYHALFPRTSHQTCGQLSWKPWEKFCTHSMKTTRVSLQSFLNFSLAASRILVPLLLFLPHPAGRVATMIGRIIILHGPWSPPHSREKKSLCNDVDIWNDPTRPLICAFNYPALALTLGKERWSELRELYLELSTSQEVKVRCTLAASLGELAKILGAENAHNDLMRVFKSSITAEEGEVRLKAVEALELFIGQLGDDDRWEVVGVLLSTWNDDRLRGWRERVGVVKLLGNLSSYQYGVPDRKYWRGRQLRDILLKGLEDGVASVRDAAISVIPSLFFGWRSRQRQLWGEFVQDLARMASDGKYSRRVTFVATQQQLLLHGSRNRVITG